MKTVVALQRKFVDSLTDLAVITNPLALKRQAGFRRFVPFAAARRTSLQNSSAPATLENRASTSILKNLLSAEQTMQNS